MTGKGRHRLQDFNKAFKAFVAPQGLLVGPHWQQFSPDGPCPIKDQCLSGNTAQCNSVKLRDNVEYNMSASNEYRLDSSRLFQHETSLISRGPNHSCQCRGFGQKSDYLMMSFPLKMLLQRRTFLPEAETPSRFDIITATLWNKIRPQHQTPALSTSYSGKISSMQAMLQWRQQQS